MLAIGDWKVEERYYGEWKKAYMITLNNERVVLSQLAKYIGIKQLDLIKIYKKTNGRFLSAEIGYFVTKKSAERVLITLKLMR